MLNALRYFSFVSPKGVNFLNETDIFQFYTLSGGENGTIDAVEAVLAGTFMENAVLENGMTYASYFTIRGCISWIAFIESGDESGSIRVRLRSRFVHINSIAEKYRGGGHACASGATVYNREEVDALLADTDALVKEYKETHEGWL